MLFSKFSADCSVLIERENHDDLMLGLESNLLPNLENPWHLSSAQK